ILSHHLSRASRDPARTIPQAASLRNLCVLRVSALDSSSLGLTLNLQLSTFNRVSFPSSHLSLSQRSCNSFTIRTSKTSLPQLLYNPHLQVPLGSAGNKGLITPLESALTERWGVGVRFAVRSPESASFDSRPAPTYNPAVSSVASQSNFISGSNRMKKSFWMCAVGIFVLLGQAA